MGMILRATVVAALAVEALAIGAKVLDLTEVPWPMVLASGPILIGTVWGTVFVCSALFIAVSVWLLKDG